MENSKLLNKLIFAIITSIILCTTSYSPVHAEGTWLYYSGEEIKGTVVDDDTKEPVEGAIVIAQWALTQIPGEGFGGYAKIHVSVTDKEGRFAVPSWASFRPWKVLSVIHGLAPKIIIYRPGYDLYWSHKLARAGYPDRMDLTKAEKVAIKEANSLTPAKLKKVHANEDIWEMYKEFRSRSHFPDDFYSAKQIKTIYDVLEREVSTLQTSDNAGRVKILKNIRESFKFWHGDEK